MFGYEIKLRQINRTNRWIVFAVSDLTHKKLRWFPGNKNSEHLKNVTNVANAASVFRGVVIWISDRDRKREHAFKFDAPRRSQPSLNVTIAAGEADRIIKSV